MAPKKTKDICEQLRKAITTSGRSHYDLARASGVSISGLGRFVSGERDLTLATAGKLANVLGLTLDQPSTVKPSTGPADAILAVLSAESTDTSPMLISALYQAVSRHGTLGQFHDALRCLATVKTVKLHPWTQAMYQLDNGECCLIQGREIMAFVARL